MKPELRRIGDSGHPLIVVDGFTGDPAAIVEIAGSLAPFPQVADTYYPGLRRMIGANEGAASAYVERTLRGAAPFIGGGFHFNGFDLVSASFSLVTTPAQTLGPQQRAPHFDSADPRYLAVMHYLTDTPGTAFYRQRATGIERVDAANVGRFVAAAKAPAAAASGYIAGSDDWYEEIGRVEGRADRLVIYQGALLHSGIIPAGFVGSADPRTGRLTANLFITGR